jgi:hypothetical protein
MVERAIGEMFGSDRVLARQITCEPSSSMMSSSTKALSKQLLGVHAALRSKNALTPQGIVRDVCKTCAVDGDRAEQVG